MEQRIQDLEEELKLLKNQIKAVLLDIKENLANGEWQEVPKDGEEAVTPYTEEEMEYEDRDGDNGEGGWYDEDEDDFEFLRNRTGHRFNWPGRK